MTSEKFKKKNRVWVEYNCLKNVGFFEFKVLSTDMPYWISYPKNATESCRVIPVNVFHR